MPGGPVGGAPAEGLSVHSADIPESAFLARLSNVRRGDCLVADEGPNEDGLIHVLDCAEPHEYEVYATHLLPFGEQFPGLTDLYEKAQSECDRLFRESFNTLYSHTAGFTQYIVFPYDDVRWRASDKVLLCALQDNLDPVRSGRIDYP